MNALQNPTPRWRRNATGETSREAAFAVAGKAPTLRERVLAILAEKPAIPETILARLIGEGVSTVLTSVRPRCSELLRMGLITDSGRREKGEGGCKAIVWRLTTEDEREAFRARAAATAEGHQHD
ncbi:MAG: hypothetical protein Q8S53_01600 [Brevundimonas sp.]|uniref:hypothetical protein n=1 Tax=Brevundimonas sp. TaxID=1871086 RepID=UPI0027352A06|nr:hypothetical protein [Brevundimonas sp.]MDP3377031.1 hypothetical protein [Brevundimonas sp.]